MLTTPEWVALSREIDATSTLFRHGFAILGEYRFASRDAEAVFVCLAGGAEKLLKLTTGQAVGSSELKTGAVTSRAIHNRSVGLRDISPAARAALRGDPGPAGPAGPAGPTLRAAVPSGGTVQRRNAVSAAHVGGTNEYRVAFNRDVSNCVATATLATRAHRRRSGHTDRRPHHCRSGPSDLGAHSHLQRRGRRRRAAVQLDPRLLTA